MRLDARPQRGRPRPTAQQDHPGHRQQQRRRDQPGHHLARDGGEHAQDAGLAPAATTADRAGLVAVQPAEAVVAEGELEDRVGLRAADVGTPGLRHQLDDRHPPAEGEHHGPERGEQVDDLLAPGCRSGDRVDQGQRGQQHERLQHLGQEAQPDQRTRRRQVPAGRGLGGPQGERRRGHVAEHHQGVRVVEPEHQGGRRGQRERQCGHDPGPVRPPRRTATCERAPHGAVEDPGGRHAEQGLGQQDAPRAQPEQPHRQRHQPEGRGRLVDRDRVARVQGAVEERRPGLRAGLHRRGVERVRVARGGQVPGVEDGHREQRERQRTVLDQRRQARADGTIRCAGRRRGGRGIHGCRSHVHHARVRDCSGSEGRLWGGCAPCRPCLTNLFDDLSCVSD